MVLLAPEPGAEIEEAPDVAHARPHERPLVREERDPLGGREPRQGADERVEPGRVVGDAVEAGRPRVRHDELRIALAHERNLLRPPAQEHPLLRHPVTVPVAQDHRHRPERRVRARLRLGEEAALREPQDPADPRDLDERVPRRPDPGVRELHDRLLRGLAERVPQVVRDRVRLRVPAHVAPDAVAEPLLAEVPLDHPEHRAALLVGDEVERLARLGHVADLRTDRVRRAQGVEVQRPRLALIELEPDAPGRVPLIHDLERHPGGERLVEPQVVPPGHRDPVAEPLVRELVRDHLGDPLLLRERGGLRVEEQRDLAVGDEAGVLHRARLELRQADLVELPERVRDPEVVLEPRQYLDRDVLPESRERELRRLRERADRDTAHGERRVRVHLPEHERDEVGRERRRLREADAPAAAEVLFAHRCSVREDDDALRRLDRELPGRLEAGLVEAGEDAPRIGGLELRRGEPVARGVEAAEPVGHAARPAELERRGAARERRREAHDDRLARGRGDDLDRVQVAAADPQPRAGDVELGAVEHDLRARLDELQVDADRSGEPPSVEVDGEHRVVRGRADVEGKPEVSVVGRVGHGTSGATTEDDHEAAFAATRSGGAP